MTGISFKGFLFEIIDFFFNYCMAEEFGVLRLGVDILSRFKIYLSGIAHYYFPDDTEYRTISQSKDKLVIFTHIYNNCTWITHTS